LGKLLRKIEFKNEIENIIVNMSKKRYNDNKNYIKDMTCKWTYRKYMDLWIEVYLYEYYHDIVEKTPMPTVEIYEIKCNDWCKKKYGEDCFKHSPEKD
jgi:hypothetical protein